MRHSYLLLLVLLGSTYCHAQLDSLQQLAAVHIVDAKLEAFSEGYQVKKLNDSLIKQNTFSLTDLLRYNSQIYFRENGYGGVSSASFRGTNAAQTAVIWNGIAINSAFTGQTDFNTITTFSSSEITVRPGGGSSQYGSGAVGGSVHLTNPISFKEEQQLALQTSLGSFETYTAKGAFTKSSDRYFIRIAGDYITSENDYSFVGKSQRNQNGQFSHLNLALDAGVKFKNSTLTYHSNFYDSERGFAGTLNVIGKDGYDNQNLRNLLSYTFKKDRWKSISKVAHLIEKFTYFPDITTTINSSNGESFQFVADQQISLKLNNDLRVGGIINYTRIDAEGTNIGTPSRNTVAGVLFAKHKPVTWLTYNVHLRQEGANGFDNPFLIAVDGQIKLTEPSVLSFNLSKNYRVPTFNDLFWDAGGNILLEPETSRLIEAGYNYTKASIRMSFAAYFIDTDNTIKWQPNAMGVWSPVNIQETNNYGVEVSAGYKKGIGKSIWDISANYAYTRAIDLEKDKQLIYVPYHKLTGLLTFHQKNISASFQSLYNSDVFTTSDNNNQLDGYFIANTGIKYRIIETKRTLDIGVSVNNIFNTFYENIASRPLPGANYTLTINLKL